MAMKIGEYRTRKIYKLGAKVVDVKVMFAQLSRVRGRDEEDNVHLEAARRYAIKIGIHVLDGVILELRSEQLEMSHADSEWQSAQQESYGAKFDSLVARLVEVRVMLDELGRVDAANEKDSEHLRTATRYAMKAAVHVLEDVVWELNTEHIERLQVDSEWQKVEAENVHQIMQEYAGQKDAEFHRLSEEAEASTR